MTDSDRAGFIDLIERRIPFNAFLGVKVLSLAKGHCQLAIPNRPELVGDARRGALHGGVISMLVDTCGGFAVWSMCALSDRIATIDMCVDYLKPAIGGDLVAESRVRLLGNRVGNAVTTLFMRDDPSVVVAEGRSVYNIRRS